MKKTVLFLGILCFITYFLQAQTFVSTTPSNKNVILEEYTGIHCVYCPDGHKRANLLADANPGRFFPINIHQGGYATPGSGEPDFRTQWGNSLAGQTGLTGYPAGTINRRVFSGSATALGRGNWEAAANIVKAEPSCVNIAAQSTIDFDTRALTVNVEVYYTGNSNTSTNYINVALLQDNIMGPQTGGETYYPEMVEDGQYRHMHMLRHLLTGQWGEEISSTTAGTFVSKQYTYTIPEQLNGVEYRLNDLQVIVFITECHQYITTGSASELTFINAAPQLLNVKENALGSCNEVQFYATLQNLWDNQNITSADFEYTYGGTTYNLSWNSRTIPSMQSDTIQFPTIAVTSGVAVPVSVTLTALNGNPFNGATKTITLSKSYYDTHKNPTLKLYTDRYASETTVKLYNSAGQVLLTEGPWSDLSASGTTEHIIPLPMENADCYKLVILDAYGDGINSGYGAGHVDVVDGLGNMIVSHNGQFASELDLFFVCDGLNAAKTSMIPATETENIVSVAKFDKYNENGICKLTAEDVQLLADGAKAYNCSAISINDIENAKFSIYPNPVTDILHIQSDEAVRKVEIYNLLGQIIKVADNTNNVDMTLMNTGIYTIKVTTNAGIKIEKIVKK